MSNNNAFRQRLEARRQEQQEKEIREKEVATQKKKEVSVDSTEKSLKKPRAKARKIEELDLDLDSPIFDLQIQDQDTDVLNRVRFLQLALDLGVEKSSDGVRLLACVMSGKSCRMTIAQSKVLIKKLLQDMIDKI